MTDIYILQCLPFFVLYFDDLSMRYYLGLEIPE